MSISAGILIRASCDDDINAIARLYCESVATGTASWEYEPPSVEEMAKRRRAVIASGFP